MKLLVTEEVEVKNIPFIFAYISIVFYRYKIVFIFV